MPGDKPSGKFLCEASIVNDLIQQRIGPTICARKHSPEISCNKRAHKTSKSRADHHSSGGNSHLGQ